MKFVSNFEIKAWDVAEDAGAAEISDISRVALRKEFDGELKGKSVGYGLFLQTPSETGGYVVLERVEAVLEDGREGTFVIQHYGIMNAEGGGAWYGEVVPKTGTGGFENVEGSFSITHEEGKAEFVWELEFPA